MIGCIGVDVEGGTDAAGGGREVKTAEDLEGMGGRREGEGKEGRPCLKKEGRSWRETAGQSVNSTQQHRQKIQSDDIRSYVPG